MTKLQAPAGPLSGSLLADLTPARLLGMRRGIEKESLRAQAGGSLALTPHPAALGSALTHPHITTDFSESQVELVTGPIWTLPPPWPNSRSCTSSPTA